MTATSIALPRRDAVPNPAPAVVVALGSNVLNDTTLDQAGATRLATAVAYAREHHARIVTIRVAGERGLTSDRAQRLAIERAGLAQEWVILPNAIGNTRGEALALRAAISDTTRVAVVTSPLHSRRACATFERVGFRVTCVVSAQYRWWFVPYAVVYETAAALKYKWNGWW